MRKFPFVKKSIIVSKTNSYFPRKMLKKIFGALLFSLNNKLFIKSFSQNFSDKGNLFPKGSRFYFSKFPDFCHLLFSNKKNFFNFFLKYFLSIFQQKNEKKFCQKKSSQKIFIQEFWPRNLFFMSFSQAQSLNEEKISC